MFLAFDDGKCPICGVNAEEDDQGFNDCPKCGTKFNEYGIVATKGNKLNLNWN